MTKIDTALVQRTSVDEDPPPKTTSTRTGHTTYEDGRQLRGSTFGPVACKEPTPLW